MQKTPDEIKKGLEICNMPPGYKDCKKCPYFEILACTTELRFDMLALIQQLQAENAEQADRIHQLEAERDAAVADLKRGGNCFACKNWRTEVCFACQYGRTRRFEWRGVQKEDSNA